MQCIVGIQKDMLLQHGLLAVSFLLVSCVFRTKVYFKGKQHTDYVIFLLESQDGGGSKLRVVH